MATEFTKEARNLLSEAKLLSERVRAEVALSLSKREVPSEERITTMLADVERLQTTLERIGDAKAGS